MAKSISGGGNKDASLTLYKPKDTVIVDLKDTRKIDPITRKPLGSKNNRSLKVNQEVLTDIISEAKAAGIDPYTALAISYQENGFASKDKLFNLNPTVFGKPFGNAQEGMKSIIEQMKFAKSMQKKKVVPDTEEYLLQGNNGYGKIRKGHADLEGATSIYGVPIPEGGINFKKNPYYGQTVMSLRDEILKNNESIKGLVDNTPASSTIYSMGGQTMKKSTMSAKERALKMKYAFGGEGGKPDPNKPIIPKTGKPTSSDSMALYNNALKVLDFYRKKGYTEETQEGVPDNITKVLDKYASEYNPAKPRTVPLKNGKAADLPLPKSQYRRDINDNQFYQREGADYILDTRAPMQMYDKRIQPTKKYRFENTNKEDSLFGDLVSMYGYDPETIKPASLKGIKSSSTVASNKAKVLPLPELNPVDIQGIIPTGSANVQANIKPLTLSNKSKFSATYRNPGKDSKQQTIYFKDKKEWQDFLGTGALNNVDTSETSDSASATGYKTGMFAGGGEAGGGVPYGDMAQLLPQLGNAIMSLTEKPSYTNQPIMNAQTAKNMTSPYAFAFGGDLDDIDDEQLKEYLQAMFMNQMEAEQEDQGDEYEMPEEVDTENEATEEDETFAMGGKVKKKKNWIKGAINPAHKGYCTPMTKSTCTPHRKALAKTFKKHHGFHAMGGDTYAAMGYYAQGGNTPIEVEGDEIVQTPDGQMQKMQGPSHEQGGIDMNVPEGTKIYSDRLELEGKTMQQRKLNREKRLEKAAKLFKNSPTNAIARNTLERTKEVVMREEQQDMALQKMANKIYAKPQQGKQAAYGDQIGDDPIDPWNDYMAQTYGAGHMDTSPYFTGNNPAILQGHSLNNSVETSNNTGANVNIPVAAQSGYNFGPTATQVANAKANSPTPAGDYSNPNAFTTGDYIGMGANLFNAIAPIINTKNAARATKPEVNRFKGFGRQALEANAKAQGFAGVQAANAKRELDTATGSAILRNRLGARSVNTMRALDTVSDINRNKAAGSIYGQYTNQMAGLLGQEGQLANQRDQMEMSGATARDQREAQNIDNYYSNMAQNLTNFGTNIGGLAKNLNQSQSNKDDTALLEQMSEYFDFGRNKSGKLVLKNKKK